MASLAISAAVNLAVGLVINYLFAPDQPDIVQEGPRLSDLSVTSSAYGKDIPVHYGTIRAGGNVIWSPGIEEVANVERQETGGGKGGGGGSVTNTTFTYFASFAIGLAEGVADDILRVFADGKLIFDKVNSATNIGGLKFRFYPGNETQLPDPLIESHEGVGNVSAHRGLAYMVFERLPLANFANRIPNITVEITFNKFDKMPFTGLTELSGQNIPGSTSGADVSSHMYLDPRSDDVYFMKAITNGLSRVSSSTMISQVMYAEDQGLSSRTTRFCADQFIYTQQSGINFSKFVQVDPVSMLETGFTLGFDISLGTWGDPFEYPNGSEIGVVEVGDPQIGLDFEPVWVISNNTGFGGDGGFVVVYDGVITLEQDNYLDTDIGRGGRVIQDSLNRRIFVTQESDTVVDIYEVFATIDIGLLGPSINKPQVKQLGTYSKGGVDYAGTADTTGWCMLPEEEAFIISNGISMFKISMDDGAVLARNLTTGFLAEDQWTDTGRFGFVNSVTGAATGEVTTIDTENLTVSELQSLSEASFPDGINTSVGKAAYDPRGHSIIYSRENGSTPLVDRVVKVLIQRGDGLGVGLDGIVADLCDKAGLEATEYDVTGLAGETVQGFSLTRQTTVRKAIEPLQNGYLFEGVESDFIMKFVPRGGSSIITIPQDEVGRLSTQNRDEFVKEVRTQEPELPMRVSVRYADRGKDYQPGTQSSKRVQNPVPSMQSGEELVAQLPIVFDETTAQQLAERILYTSWAERSSLETVLPWKYLALDPTDIFTLIFQGDIRRLRMANMELGANLDIEVVATQEDSRSNVSGLPADGGLGHLAQVVPSVFPTKFLPLDLPLLFAADASLQTFSRGYWAVAGYDETFSGAILYQSRDSGTTFLEIGSGPFEASWGITKTVISPPGTVTEWDETSTIDILVVRGIDNWTSATDLEVLNGANSMAVAGPDGPEIIQFATVTVLDVATVRLSRLLRGRRGTDVPELTDTHVAAEEVVLLEPGKIFTLQNSLDIIEVSLPYRAITFNTSLEDGFTTFVKYTGQDLIPYSVVNITSNLIGRTADLTLEWFRRTRFNGELRNGTGDVPLNESIKEYQIDFRWGGDIVATKSFFLESGDLTLVEWEAISHPDGPTDRLLLSGEVAMVNPDFEIGVIGQVPTGWTNVLGTPGGGKRPIITEGGFDTLAKVGEFFVWMGESAIDDVEIRQDMDLVALGYNVENLDITLPTVTFSYWHQEVRDAHDDTTQVIVEFRDATDAVISSFDSGAITPVAEDTWEEVILTGPLPIGTRTIRVRLQGHRFGFGLDTAEVMFDNVRLQMGTGVPPLQADIYQMSAITGRGRKATVSV